MARGSLVSSAAGDSDSKDGGGNQRSLADAPAAGIDGRVDATALACGAARFLEIIRRQTFAAILGRKVCDEGFSLRHERTEELIVGFQ